MMIKARDAFYTVPLAKSRVLYVDGEPHVAMMADKVTLNKRTVDITVINVVVPEAYPRKPS